MGSILKFRGREGGGEGGYLLRLESQRHVGGGVGRGKSFMSGFFSSGFPDREEVVLLQPTVQK